MNSFFWISYAILWILVVPLVILNLVLFRQLGIMVMGTARGVNQSGIPVGNKMPRATTTTLQGAEWSTGELIGTPSLMLFGSPTCKECAEILPDFQRIAMMNNVKPILLLFASADLALDYVRKIAYDDEVLIVSSEFANHLDVQVTPYAYAVDANGTIRHKGLVNSREQLEAYAKASRVS
ncbi:thioredoxin fold domain-containing protein [Paenibacillus lautus]|jgi:methylamine dehydrogenase accessory protein MauD|uniref:Methylamine dehydrogenase n=1 Tax=Paenibacillus lautus TaxID=1401 RepID=A0A385TH26_PAELA|nr:thioredoxin fold domain-containing protein [Paenibacillus lautus]AYB43870.1 methylamine dehydrogenase [Paenibacillus lautus]MCI1777544.1 thioredoxin fold domain-containing protein [Paenibacillus lautus]